MTYTFIAKLLSYVFVLIIYLFIIKIIQLVTQDIEVMRRRKNGDASVHTYIKLLNLRHSLDFPWQKTIRL
ncbi:MAG: hypothetical protein IJN25_06530 [Clostridia bacterium]|nr:hypothetical protein [Clostridia bacterium]